MKTSSQINILAVDDDEDGVLSLVRTLKLSLPSYSFSACTNESKALQLASGLKPAVVILDLCLDETSGPQTGFDLLQKLLSLDSTTRIIVLTGYGSVEAGVKCLTLGASNFLDKPPDIPHLSALIKDGVAQANLRRSYAELSTKLSEPILDTIIGQSVAANQLKDSIRYAASNNQSILITGETGTGKGLCAVAIHKLSNKPANKYVRYQPNFGTADLVNSDLFGHVKGAFTGADANRAGLFEEAKGGTLFLDEIDELPMETQVSLLGILQDRVYRPLGSNKEMVAEVRLIAATNQEIGKILSEKKIRQDFFHRIAHSTIHLPSLRERLEDINKLAEHFLLRLRENEKVAVFEISRDAINRLKSHRWPGNIRELQAVIEGGAYRAQFEGRSLIEVQDIHIGFHGIESSTPMNFHEKVKHYKLKLINEALDRNKGNQLRAAQDLGIDRANMRRFLSSETSG